MQWKQKLAVYTLCIFCTSSSYTMVVPFLPVYLLTLGADNESIAYWSAACFSISFLIGGIMAPIWGRLADLKGRKSMAVRSALMLALAYLSGGIVLSPLQLFGMRALQGFANGYLPSILTLTSGLAPVKSLGLALSTIQAADMAGKVSGPLIGGLMAHFLGYRASFFAAGSILVIVALATMLVPSTQDKKPAAALPASTLKQDFTTAWRHPAMRELLLLFFFFCMVMLCLQPIISLFVGELTGSLKDAALYAGIACSIPALVGSLISPLWGIMGQRRGYYPTLAIALCGTAIFLIIQSFAGSLTFLFISSALMGLFITGIVPSLNAALALCTPPEFRGRGFGIMTMAGQFGYMSGPIISALMAAALPLKAQFAAAGLALLLMAWYVQRYLIKHRRR